MLRDLDHRLIALAIVVGLVAEGALAVAVLVGGDQLRPLGLLLPVEAVVLGFTFGARPGLFGAGVPPLVLFAAEMVRRSGDADVGTSATVALSYSVYAALLLGFIGWMCGAIRDRFIVG